MNIIKWLKELFYIVKFYRKDQHFLLNRIRENENFIRSKTDINADIHFKGRDGNWVIVVGRYKNNDYVQSFLIDSPEFENVIMQLKDMQRFGCVKRIDAPPQMRMYVERDLKY